MKLIVQMILLVSKEGTATMRLLIRSGRATFITDLHILHTGKQPNNRIPVETFESMMPFAQFARIFTISPSSFLVLILRFANLPLRRWGSIIKPLPFHDVSPAGQDADIRPGRSAS
jgi:hypothetical protein